jgi:hypothetical protein
MSLVHGQTAWLEEAVAPPDTAPITAIWVDPADGSDAAAAVPGYFVVDGLGDITVSAVGPAGAEAIDSTGTGVFDLTALPTGLTGPRLSVLTVGGGTDFIVV